MGRSNDGVIVHIVMPRAKIGHRLAWMAWMAWKPAQSPMLYRNFFESTATEVNKPTTWICTHKSSHVRGRAPWTVRWPKGSSGRQIPMADVTSNIRVACKKIMSRRIKRGFAPTVTPKLEKHQWNVRSYRNTKKVNIKTIWNPFPGVYVILRTFSCDSCHYGEIVPKTAKNGQTHACTILNALKPD